MPSMMSIIFTLLRWAEMPLVCDMSQNGLPFAPAGWLAQLAASAQEAGPDPQRISVDPPLHL